MPVRQLSFNSRSARMSFSQVQRVLTVKQYLASCSYFTCQNEFRDTFSDSSVPNKSTTSHLVNSFRHTGSVQDRNCSGWPPVLSDFGWYPSNFIMLWTFTTLDITLFLFYDLNVVYFLTNRTRVRNGLHHFLITQYILIWLVPCHASGG
jgi:hypothetical protein